MKGFILYLTYRVIDNESYVWLFGKLENNVTESKKLIIELILEKKNLIMFFITMLALQGIMLFYMIKLM